MDNKTNVIIEKLLSEVHVINDMIIGLNKKQFMNDEKTQRAVSMTLINMGELVKLLPINFRRNHNNVPWKEVAGMRDVVAHKYQTIRMEDVWITIKNDIPVFYNQLKSILGK